jgi:neutral ceramidase
MSRFSTLRVLRSAGVLVVAALGGLGFSPFALAAETLRVGRAKVQITPPIGSVMGNSYGISIVKGVTSPLHARALAFESGGIRAAVVACDLISLHRPIVEQTRRLIRERTGIPPENVILSATHCHSGPQTHPIFLEAVGGEAQRISEGYVAELPGLIAESVRLAEADLQAARMFAGVIREESLAFNRRFLLRDGTVDTNPGRRNPQVIRPMGPVDPDVSIVYVESTQGRPLATYVNFALHVAVAGGAGRGQISADFPHTLAELLGRVKGEAMLTVFTTGMSGNVNHVDVGARTQGSGEAEAARIGTVLAAAVLKALPKLTPVAPAPLRAAARPVRAPARPVPPPDEVARARETIRRHGKGAPFLDVVHAWRGIDLATYAPDGYWPSEVQAVTFGHELALVGYPGDSFVELGLFIKQNSPYALTVVSEQSGNGSLGYIPNEKAYPEGSYEVESARLAPGGGDLLAAEAARLLRTLFPSGAGAARPTGEN